jgi:hypothetical protein
MVLQAFYNQMEEDLRSSVEAIWEGVEDLDATLRAAKGTIISKVQGLQAKLIAGKEVNRHLVRDLEAKLRAAEETKRAAEETNSHRVRDLEEKLRAAEETNSHRVRALFSDSGGVPISYPVIDEHGVIQHLDKIIALWATEGGLGSVRLFRCPVSNDYTKLAEPEIINSVLEIAKAAGLDIGLPLHFEYLDGGAWTEFSLGQQLDLIVCLCMLYCDRRKTTRAESKRLDIQGRHVTIVMGTVQQQEAFLLTPSSDQVSVKLVIKSGWIHPFKEFIFSGVAP